MRVLLLLIGSIAFALTTISCARWRTSEVVYVPLGYVGWVRIEYSVMGAPRLEEKDNRFIIHIPPDGQITTSTPMEAGIGNDEYYDVDLGGKATRLKLAEKIDDNSRQIRAPRYITVPRLQNQKTRELRVFFVGSLEAYESAPKDNDWLLGSKSALR